MALWGIDTRGQLPVRPPRGPSCPLRIFPFSSSIPIRPLPRGKPVRAAGPRVVPATYTIVVLKLGDP